MIELIVWSDELSVNIEEIDKQHKKLIDVINVLFNAMIEGKTQNIIDTIIDDLIDYAKYHFSTEEKYF
jgi:hemerythrin-like metal-binding protein